MTTDGYLALVLHAHLPFVRHPEYPEFLEEDWLFEAITETYLPLLEVYERLWDEGVDFRISMTMSPPLLSMFNDDLLRQRYAEKIKRLIRLAKRECSRHRDEPHQLYLAEFYLELFERRQKQYEELYERDLTKAFRKFVERGSLEVLTCGATHGFLPLLQDNRQSVWAQIEVAARYHEDCFGRRPSGIWLPECAYFPGLDGMLRAAGIRYFIGESHAIEFAVPKPRYGVHAPIYTPAGVAVFARDQTSSAQVWSSKLGYPGDPAYREFYRDIGYDAPLDYIKPWIQPNGKRKNTGIKYHRVTGENVPKEHYDPYWAKEKVAFHAHHFTNSRRWQLDDLHREHGRPGLVVAPFDAELFGHWWFEGPMWIEYVLRQVSCDRDTFELTTPLEYLGKHPSQQVSQPPMSTWGELGYAKVWLNPANDWVYPHLDAMGERMTELADRYEAPTDLELRALNQAARELLLAQSSDWPFIITKETSVDYALKRLQDHIVRFNRLYEQLSGFGLDEDLLTAIETRDTIFPDIDYTIWRTPS